MGDSLGISDREMKAKIITSCDNAFVTNIVLLLLLLLLLLLSLSHKQNPLLPLRCTHAFAQKTSVGPRPWSEAAHRTPPGKRPAGTEINHTL